VDIPIIGWSTAPIASWPIIGSPGGYSEVVPVVSLSQSEIQNGESATLTVEIPTSAQHGQIAYVAVYSGYPKLESFWPVAVHVQ